MATGKNGINTACKLGLSQRIYSFLEPDILFGFLTVLHWFGPIQFVEAELGVDFVNPSAVLGSAQYVRFLNFAE